MPNKNCAKFDKYLEKLAENFNAVKKKLRRKMKLTKNNADRNSCAEFYKLGEQN